MDIIQVDQKTCTQCGICAAECPGLVIDFQPESYPRPMARTEMGCIRCGHCVVVCPTGSLTHREIPVEKCAPINELLKVTPDQCEGWLKSRRSVRVFKKQSVPREMITRLIEDARYAPTGHNNQELEWLVLDSRSELDRIEKLGTDWIIWILKNQPRMAAMFNMEEMIKRQEKNHNVFMRGAPVLVVTHAAKNNSMALIDSATALGYMDLVANSLGLGVCWAGFVYVMANSFAPVTAVLSLPEGHSAYGCMMLGYNKFQYYRIPARKAPGITWR
jgi:nitroreductase/NAD-dependent dihydropyrimidine dehydrogenase PreA subunit